MGKQAGPCKAQYLHGRLRRKSDRDKRESECAIPGEIWRFALCYLHREVWGEAPEVSKGHSSVDSLGNQEGAKA